MRRLQRELRRSEKTVAELQASVGHLKSLLMKQEMHQTASNASTTKSSSRKRDTAKRSNGRRNAGRRKDTRSSGSDINTVTFEELRHLGLSVTQSARLIGFRETRGKFESIDQLDDLYGFPAEIIVDLKRKLAVRSSKR